MFLLFHHTLYSTAYINKLKKGKQNKILTNCWICNIYVYVRIEQFDNPIWQKILTDFEIIGNCDIHVKQKISFIYKIKWDEMS